MAYIVPLGWINDDAEGAIRSTLNLTGNESCTDIAGIGPSVKYSLNIDTVNDLVGYVLYNGFPSGMNNETVFMLSILCARKIGAIMPAPESE